MNNLTYDYIWDEIINIHLEKIYNLYKNDIITAYNPNNYDKIKQTILEKYNFEKDRLKELYHCGEDANNLIDIHKIAACFTKVLVNEKIFKFSLEEDIDDEIFLINAELAYYVGIDLIKLSLIYFYLEIDIEENERERILNELSEIDGLLTPPTNAGHDEYNLGRKKTLNLNYIFENEFDILTYSDMLFWIEYYNRQMLEKTNTPRKLEERNRICDSLI